MDAIALLLPRETLTQRRRQRFPARQARKDARTLALRLAYGPQSNLTTAVVASPAERRPADEVARERDRLQQALAASGYATARCREILAAFDRRHARPAGS